PPPPAPPTLSLHDALPISTSQSLSARDRAASARGRISCSERRCSNPARIESAVIDCNQSLRVGFFPPIQRMVLRKISSPSRPARSEEHTSELQSRFDLVCR